MWEEGHGAYITTICPYKYGAIAAYKDGSIRVFPKNSVSSVLLLETSYSSVTSLKIKNNILCSINNQ